MAGGIFISYRREDSAGFAGRLRDRLVSRFASDHVFMDVDNIEPGLDFVEILGERVGNCEVLLAVIGRDWATCRDANGNRRLDDPCDFVRIEIEAALGRNVRVIPALVDGAAMPRADVLPDGLRPLTRRQAVEISHTRFDMDAERLLRALAQIEEARQEHEAEHAAKRTQNEEVRESAARAEDGRTRRAGTEPAKIAEAESSPNATLDAAQSTSEQAQPNFASPVSPTRISTDSVAPTRGRLVKATVVLTVAAVIAAIAVFVGPLRDRPGMEKPATTVAVTPPQTQVSQPLSSSSAAPAPAPIPVVPSTFSGSPSLRPSSSAQPLAAAEALPKLEISAAPGSAPPAAVKELQPSPSAASSTIPIASATLPAGQSPGFSPLAGTPATASPAPTPTPELEKRQPSAPAPSPPIPVASVTPAASPSSWPSPLAQTVTAPSAAPTPQESFSDADPRVVKCDQLAASPEDVRRPVSATGIDFEKIFGLAVDVCRTAFAVFPDEPRMQYELGRALEAERSYGEAVKFYQLASNRGYAAAQNNLGAMYASGKGVEKDLALAFVWLRKAADEGLASAQYQVGAAYEGGQGAMKDSSQALAWYRKAAGQGDPSATAAVKRLTESPQVTPTKMTSQPAGVAIAPKPTVRKPRAIPTAAPGNSIGRCFNVGGQQYCN